MSADGFDRNTQLLGNFVDAAPKNQLPGDSAFSRRQGVQLSENVRVGSYLRLAIQN